MTSYPVENEVIAAPSPSRWPSRSCAESLLERNENRQLPGIVDEVAFTPGEMSPTVRPGSAVQVFVRAIELDRVIETLVPALAPGELAAKQLAASTARPTSDAARRRRRMRLTR